MEPIMTAITATGTYDAKDVSELGYTSAKKGYMFTGTLPTTLELGILVNGTFTAVTGGAVTTTPSSLVVETIPPQGLALNVTGGSPDFVITSTGAAGPLRS